MTIDLTTLKAAVATAEAERDAAQKRLNEANYALECGIRDEWIERARAALPTPAGGAEGWLTYVNENWCGLPDPKYTVFRGRLIATGVVVGKSVEVTVQRQRRTESGEVEYAKWALTVCRYQLHTDDGRTWAKRLGLTVMP